MFDCSQPPESSHGGSGSRLEVLFWKSQPDVHVSQMAGDLTLADPGTGPDRAKSNSSAGPENFLEAPWSKENGPEHLRNV